MGTGFARKTARKRKFGALNEHMRAHDPFERASSESVAIEVESALPLSADSWRIEWREDTHSRDAC